MANLLTRVVANFLSSGATISSPHAAEHVDIQTAVNGLNNRVGVKVLLAADQTAAAALVTSGTAVAGDLIVTST